MGDDRGGIATLCSDTRHEQRHVTDDAAYLAQLVRMGCADDETDSGPLRP